MHSCGDYQNIDARLVVHFIRQMISRFGNHEKCHGLLGDTQLNTKQNIGSTRYT